MLMNIRRYIKTEKGFTLIELVVVIAILGILAAIAIPRFAASSNSARGAKMQADLRTIDSAIQICLANGTAVVNGAVTAAVNPGVAGNLAAVPTPAAGTYAAITTGTVAAGINYVIAVVGGTQRATVVTNAVGSPFVAETL